jgi:hypothetical protein
MHSHYPLLPLATTISSVLSLFRYHDADVFIGRVSSQTRYLTDNGDVIILTDSVDSLRVLSLARSLRHQFRIPAVIQLLLCARRAA